MRKRFVASSCFVVLLAPATALHAQQARARPLPCAQMQGLSVPAGAIGLPTGGAQVSEAVVVPAAGSNASTTPEHCRLTGTIAPVDPLAPRITFRVVLPVAWNGKAMMFGGGGFNGTVPNVAGNVPAGPTDQPTPWGAAMPRSPAIRVTRPMPRGRWTASSC
ncbi:MAG: tannase/feruloyl esterase family alpha/beta hydrolase [Cellvibrionaceae bacterium]|nr:tannase/feruloyl esterase family alpha/beta hydrolase [Cellvibrionaceae bacterium]